MKPALSERRNITALAISDGTHTRPSGLFKAYSLNSSSVHIFSVRGVLVRLGLTVLTFMLYLASSKAETLESIITPDSAQQ
jgi:hypothetical protein